MAFFAALPNILYDIENGKISNYQIVKNILFRVNILKDVLSNISAYYYYTITDEDKPEILAEKVYGDPTAYWIILYANDIYDPQYDWPLDYKSFQNYIVNKYGSIANSKTSIHHYEKVVMREDSLSGEITESRFWIDYNTKTNAEFELASVSGDFTVGNTVYVSADSTLANATITGTVAGWSNVTNQIIISNLVVPGNTQLKYQTLLEANSSVNGVVSVYVFPTDPYDTYLSLPLEQSVEAIDMNGQTVVEIIKKDSISNYDYEEQQNERKRVIKIIKAEYYDQIKQEFNNLTNNALYPLLRKLR